MKTRFFVLMALLIGSVALTYASPALAGDFAGHWEGVVEIPGMDPGLVIKTDFEQLGQSWTGTIDIPLQGAIGLPLETVEVEGDTIRFVIADVQGVPTFVGGFTEGKISGTFTQGGARFPFWLSRDAAPEVKRPQEPKPPLPYRAFEVVFGDSTHELSGTLTLPDGDGPFAAVVLVTGSGPEDRDETVFNHRPFLIISDHLTRNGIAVLRYDDRGVGKSTGDFASATTKDFADDALMAVRFLKERTDIAGDRIGILGHSEGGLIAPLAATQSKDVAFVIMLAGPGVPGSEILVAQTEKIALASGLSMENAKQQVDIMKRTVDIVMSETDPQKIHDAALALAREQVALLPEEERKALGENPDPLLERQIQPVLTPWFRYFLTHDPRPTLAKVTVPVLALNGSLDTQVPAAQNLPEIEKALEKAGNKDVTITELPGLNHLFQKATTGAPGEYFGIEETMNPAALDAMTVWLRERFVK